MTMDELPPLSAHPVARAYDRSGAPMPNRGWTDTEAAKIRAHGDARAAEERERCEKVCMGVMSSRKHSNLAQEWEGARLCLAAIRAPGQS